MRPGDVLRTGELNQRVTLRRPILTEPDVIDSYEDIDTVWAKVEPVRGREMMEAGKETAEHDTRIYIRYVPGLDTAKQAVHRGTAYDIRAVVNVNASDRVLELQCRVVQ